jgi:hypothetical protein
MAMFPPNIYLPITAASAPLLPHGHQHNPPRQSTDRPPAADAGAEHSVGRQAQRRCG